jgi:DNA polymerase III epsilon subunit-like protein
MHDINFIAIDFETATGKRASICEAGICVVKGGKVVETKSWLVRPEDNRYSYWNIQIHGIHPEDTVSSPEFPKVWAEICEYLKDCPVLVAHNAAFDMGCIRHSLELYDLPTPDVETLITIVLFVQPVISMTLAATLSIISVINSKSSMALIIAQVTMQRCVPACCSVKSRMLVG